MIKKFIKEEKDGTITKMYAMEMNGKWISHNEKGPSRVNKGQGIGECYSYGVKIDCDNIKKKNR